MCELEKVYLGRDKVCLDEADMDLNVSQATTVFGSFIKYTVKTVHTLPHLQFIFPCKTHLKSCFTKKFSKLCTCSQILFQEKMNTTYYSKSCMVLTLLKYTDHLHSNEAKCKKTLPFVPSIQQAKKFNLMIQCEECDMWWLIYSKKKLTLQDKK